MKCKKCGVKKITKFYKDYCSNCSKNERLVVKTVKESVIKDVLRERACSECDSRMEKLEGNFGIYLKCTNKKCGITTSSKVKKTIDKPNNEILEAIASLDAKKKFNSLKNKNSLKRKN